MCHRKRWPRSSFLSQERPWPQTFCKIRPILAKNLYFSAYFPLFLLFSWRRILANRFCFLNIFLNEMRKKERFGREISLPKVASSSLKMQRKCRKEKDKKFCLDETKRKMARYQSGCWVVEKTLILQGFLALTICKNQRKSLVDTKLIPPLSGDRIIPKSLKARKFVFLKTNLRAFLL